jgi:hypothetical protein
MEEFIRLAGKVRDTGDSLFAVKGWAIASTTVRRARTIQSGLGRAGQWFSGDPQLSELGGQWTKSMVRGWCVEAEGSVTFCRILHTEGVELLRGRVAGANF